MLVGGHGCDGDDDSRPRRPPRPDTRGARATSWSPRSSASRSASCSGSGASRGRGRWTSVFVFAPPLKDLALRGLADAGRPGAATSSASRAPRCSRRWSRPACRRSSGSQWGVDTLLSGFVQGAAAELVFAFTLYRAMDVPGPGRGGRGRRAARRGSTTGSLYYADVSLELQLVRASRWRSPPSSSWPAARSSLIGRSGRPACSRGSPTDGEPLAGRAGSDPRGAGVSVAGRPAGVRGTSRSTLEPGAGACWSSVRPGRARARSRSTLAGLVPREIPARRSTVASSSTARRSATALGRRDRRPVGLVFQDPATSSSWSASRTTSRSGSRTGLAAAGDARAGARGARRGRAGRPRAPSVAALSGRTAAAARAAPARSPAPRDPRPRRADREPRPGGGAARSLERLPRCPTRGRDHRPRRAPGRRRLAARRPRAGARARRPARSTSGRRPSVLAARSGPPRCTARGSGCRRRRYVATRAAVAGRAIRGPAAGSAPCVTANDVSVRLRPGPAGRPRRRPRDPGRGSGSPSSDQRRGKSTLAQAARRPAAPHDRRASASAVGALADLAPAELARGPAYVFQDPERQFARLRVDDEVMLGLDDAGRRRAEALMARHRPPARAVRAAQPVPLSGGEQRRLSLASRARPRTRRCSSSTSRRSARTAAATRRCSTILAAHLDDGAAMLAATHDERFIEDFAAGSSDRAGLDRATSSWPRAAATAEDRRVTARRPTVIERLEPTRSARRAPRRDQPVVKLAIALVWLVGLAFTLRLLTRRRS